MSVTIPTHDFFEGYPLNREQVARACGISAAQVKGWGQDRGRLFPEKEQGRGSPWTYTLRDAMKLAVVSALVDRGFSVGEACDAIRPLPLADNSTPVVLTKDGEGKWVQSFDAEEIVSIRVDMLKIYQRVAARLEEVVSEDASLSDADRKAFIANLRAKTVVRWWRR